MQSRREFIEESQKNNAGLKTSAKSYCSSCLSRKCGGGVSRCTNRVSFQNRNPRTDRKSRAHIVPSTTSRNFSEETPRSPFANPRIVSRMSAIEKNVTHRSRRLLRSNCEADPPSALATTLLKNKWQANQKRNPLSKNTTT